ncbi:MAG: hypothetical protein E6I59_07130 [Chloroflexi bacterium]|nr:MAG: hypothetical protein E6I59_07130 [Chloroflexota bacterium]
MNVSDASSLARARRARLTRKGVPQAAAQVRRASRRARLTARVNPTIYDAAPRATLRVKGQAHVVGRDGLSGGVGGRGRRTTQGVPRPYGYRAASEAGSCRTWLLGVSARDLGGFLSDFATHFSG